MASLLSFELSSACSSLGVFDKVTRKYHPGAHVLESLKNIIRFMRKDNEDFDVRRQLGETKVVQTDIIPILRSCWEQSDIFGAALRVAINLSSPTYLLWPEGISKQKGIRKQYLQVEGHLRAYKEAFTEETVWVSISTKLSSILEIKPSERGEEGGLIIERILVLIRNILHVEAGYKDNRPIGDVTVHDQVLWALHQAGMLDVFLYITNTARESEYYMHMLEILTLMLKEQNANELAGSLVRRSEAEKMRDEAELLAARLREKLERQEKEKMSASSRHSRFGGTFVLKSHRAISNNKLIYHGPLSKADQLNFDEAKSKRKTPKNRAPESSSTSLHRSSLSIRLFLKDFCVEFVKGAYNDVMRYSKAYVAVMPQLTIDEPYYLMALRFFMEFNRNFEFDLTVVTETMSVKAFHYLQQLSEKYFDLMHTDKKKIQQWAERLHLTVLAYREMLMTLRAMCMSTDSSTKDSAKVIMSNIFYVPEYREFILTLLVTYDELKFSEAYLLDLMETQHIFLKLFEAFCAKHGSVMVRKMLKGKKRSNKKAAAAGGQPAGQEDPNLEEMWHDAEPHLSIMLHGGVDLAAAVAEAVPFDAASDMPIDDQKADAMKSVQRKLRSGDYEDAIGLLRASREVWPENDSFGSNNMTVEEELLALRDIFFADLGQNLPVEVPDTFEEDEDDDEEGGAEYSESTYKFEDFVKRLPNPRIVRTCGMALRRYDRNSVYTNHCIVKLLHRIAFDCKMYVVLFQVSIFKTFDRIFASQELPQYSELVRFATYIMKQFFKLSTTNIGVFVEALFWKTSKDAYEIENGYGSYKNVRCPAKRADWSEEEEEKLRNLFHMHDYSDVNQDVVDWIVDQLNDETRTRRIVLKKLRDMRLLGTEYTGRSESEAAARLAKGWTAEEEANLRELYEMFKDDDDPMGCITLALQTSRPRNRIIEKMLVMGLIQDRKQVWKKRAKGSRPGRNRSQTSASSGSDSEDNTVPSLDAPSTSKAAAPRRNKKPAAPRQKPAKEKKPKKKKEKLPRILAPRSLLAEMLLNNMQSGHAEALHWLKDSFCDAIEDFEDGSSEGIVLLPIMDYAETAMEDAGFQLLLNGFGVCKPADAQEMYWRIPADLSVDTLNGYCELIQAALDKTLTLPIDDEINQVGNAKSDVRKASDGPCDRLNLSDDDSSEYLRAGADIIAKYTSATYDSDVHVESDSQQEPCTSFRSKDSVAHSKSTKQLGGGVQRKMSSKVTDSDDESGDASRAVAGVGNTSLTKKKARQIVDSESEPEGDGDTYAESKRVRPLSDSDSEKPTAKRNRIIESDEE